jgi:hypothetical protein
VIIALPELTEITDVSINNYSKEDPTTWAKDVEVEVSSTFSYKGFSAVGKLSMPQIGDLHTISLQRPIPAKYVKIFFRANHGGSYMEAARVRVRNRLKSDRQGAAGKSQVGAHYRGSHG